MAEEIDFEISHFRKFDGPVTLTLDDLEIHIVENDLSTSTNVPYWLVATLRLIVDGHVFTNCMSHLCSSAEMTNKNVDILFEDF